MRSLMWFRADLRVKDNPALTRACADASRGVVAFFAVCPKQWKDKHDWGDARVGFLVRTLSELRGDLAKLKIPLLVRTCDSFRSVPEVLLELAQRHQCDGLYFNREFEVNEIARDEQVTRQFTNAGLEVQSFIDQTTIPPGSIRTGKGDFYSVFTPFKKAWIDRVQKSGGVAVVPKPKAQPSFATASEDPPERIAGFNLSNGHTDLWPAGEREAQRRLKRFMSKSIDDYAKERDHPALDTTSRLSPYLAVGAISVRQCLAAAVEANGGSNNGRKSGAATWISELIWREFYRHVLVGWPRVCKHRAFQLKTEKVRWRTSDRDFAAWCDGRTGYPIVDAAMRQLNQTGWMHNRLRMVVAMFLSKHLLIDWRRGERYFMQRLIDGDLASNNGGWQWAASTGTDAAPYFRVFNPYSQSRKFDAKGEFIRVYLPELRELDNKAIHAPHENASLFTSLDYPKPIVDHAKARRRAIEAFEKIK